MTDELLTPEEIDKFHEDYWIGRVKPQSIKNLMRMVAQAQLAKARPIIEAKERETLINWLQSNNPFVGYIDVVENIRMAKEQGWDRAWQALKGEQ